MRQCELIGAFVRWLLHGGKKKFSIFLTKKDENFNMLVGFMVSILLLGFALTYFTTDKP